MAIGNINNHMSAPCGIDKIIVSGATNNFEEMNGLYVWTEGDGSYLNGAYISDNFTTIYFNTDKWIINKNMPNFHSVDAPPCLPDVTGWTNPFGAPGTPPTSIVAYIDDPITLRNNKYATANESGANRFRRLNSLGYV